jgi:hypothetical protein
MRAKINVFIAFTSRAKTSTGRSYWKEKEGVRVAGKERTTGVRDHPVRRSGVHPSSNQEGS